jgi:hypothetical protein
MEKKTFFTSPMQCEDESIVVFRDSSINEAGFKLLITDSHNNEFFDSMTDQAQSTNTTPMANNKSCRERNFDVNSCKITLKFQTENINCNETRQEYKNTAICGKREASEAGFEKCNCFQIQIRQNDL